MHILITKSNNTYITIKTKPVDLKSKTYINLKDPKLTIKILNLKLSFCEKMKT